MRTIRLFSQLLVLTSMVRLATAQIDSVTAAPDLSAVSPVKLIYEDHHDVSPPLRTLTPRPSTDVSV